MDEYSSEQMNEKRLCRSTAKMRLSTTPPAVFWK